MLGLFGLLAGIAEMLNVTLSRYGELSMFYLSPKLATVSYTHLDVYKRQEKGIRKGKILLLKDVLNQKFALTETDEACLSNLTEEDINQIVHILYKINTLEDFHDQLKKLSDLKNRVINNTQFSFSHD